MVVCGRLKSVLTTSDCEGDLTNGVYDEQGNVYVIPKFVLTYPTNCRLDDGDDGTEAAVVPADHDSPVLFSEPLDVQKGQPLAAEPDHVLKARLSHNGGEDILIHFNSGDTVAVICARIAEKANVSNAGQILDTSSTNPSRIDIIEHYEADNGLFGKTVSDTTLIHGLWSQRADFSYVHSMRDENTLFNQGWKEGLVVNVMVRPRN